MVLKFSANMYHPTLGMPWSKEQVENRLSQVRNQSSSLVCDWQDVVLVVMVVNVCTSVRVEGYVTEWGASPTEPSSHFPHVITGNSTMMFFQII